MIKKPSQNKVWRAITILSFIGILLAVYLFYSYLTKPSFQPCSINAKINCDAVIKGEVSTTLGIPTALYGLIGYILIFAASIKRFKKLILFVATFGLLFCLRITFLELFIIKIICPICITCQLIMLVVFLLSLKLYFTNVNKY